MFSHREIREHKGLPPAGSGQEAKTTGPGFTPAGLVQGWAQGLTELLLPTPAQPGGEGAAGSRGRSARTMMPELGAKGPISQ